MFGYVSKIMDRSGGNFLGLIDEAIKISQTKEGAETLKEMGEEGKEIRKILKELGVHTYRSEKGNKKSNPEMKPDRSCY